MINGTRLAKRTRCAMPVFLMVILSLGIACYADEQDGLLLHLSTPRARICQFEPLVVHVTITNIGAQSREFVKPCSLAESPFLAVEVRFPDGGGFVPYRPVIHINAICPRVVLQSGQSCCFVDTVFFSGNDREGFIFSKPGTYHLRATFVPPGQSQKSYTSETFEVCVVAPEGEDADALALWIRAHQKSDGLLESCGVNA